MNTIKFTHKIPKLNANFRFQRQDEYIRVKKDKIEFCLSFDTWRGSEELNTVSIPSLDINFSSPIGQEQTRLKAMIVVWFKHNFETHGVANLKDWMSAMNFIIFE